MCDRADIVFRDGQWVRLALTELQVPPTVRDSTRERVDRLSPAAQQTLRAAAVLAEWSSGAALASTAGLTPEEARAGIAEAADARILSGDERGRWRFRHVLVATAVYEAVARTDRGSPAPQSRRGVGVRRSTARRAPGPPLPRGR